MLRRARSHGDESGIALIAVIGIGAVLTILVTAMLASSVSGVVKAQVDQSWSAAMSAAYAGVEDYKSKLANDNTYQQYGNPAALFSAGSSFTGTHSNPAFGTGTSGSWASVPVAVGDTSSPRAFYRYEVDNSKYASTGVLRIRATGRVGQSTRSIVADLKQHGFIDYVYFTDYEIRDPDVSSTACTPAYGWAVSSRPNCTMLQFAPADVLNGPVHSNDTLLICGATFKDAVETGYNPANGIRYQVPAGSCPTPSFAIAASPVAASPSYGPPVAMPPTNTQMKQETRSDLLANGVPRPGCLYTGPTTINFNANGTMTVRSPWTVKTNVAGDPASSGTISTNCGTPGWSAGGNTLGSAAGQTLAVPANNLIFVQGVPRTSTDPNYWAAAAYPTGVACTYTTTMTCTGGTGSSGTANGIGYPTANERAPSSTTSAPSYGYDKGDVFVQGQVHGAVTIAADNYIYAVGDITYVDPQVDILGLVGQNSIWVRNPVNSSADLIDNNGAVLSNPSLVNREIDAALLSVAHSFGVQNYDLGLPEGNLTIKGSIAQKFRGAVGTGTISGGVTTIASGFAKNYVYDSRLRYLAPPKFLSPVSTSYGVSVLVEVKTAFAPDGSAIP
jgi:hypothetical protein